MNREKVNNLIREFSKNKAYQFLTALFISLAIVFVSWHYFIEELHTKKISLQKSIEATNLEELKKEIEELRIKEQELIKSYKVEQDNFKALDVKIYKTHYPIMINILDKINSYSFNIHSYRLNSTMSRMDIDIEGSYQNFIRFIDFLGTIPATVIVKNYTITLSKDDMMIIKLGIEVAPIRI